MRVRSRTLLAIVALAVPAFAWSADQAAEPAKRTYARIKQDSANDDVLRAQVLLERAHFSPGEIDGVFGTSVAKAVSGFQRNRDLPDTGVLDEATWAELERDELPALIDYTLTEADVAGPYVTIPIDLIEKAALPALGFQNIYEALGERFHASPKLLKSLNKRAKWQPGEVIQVPNVENLSPLPKAAKVMVTQSTLTLTLHDANDKVYAQFPATTGSSNDPLPVGTWKINGVARNPVFNYNPDLFWNANPEHVKARLQAGPNNPVGTVWIDLSKEHYGIHGTPEPSKIGKTESNGCIRLTNWSAALVAGAVSPGLQAILQD